MSDLVERLRMDQEQLENACREIYGKAWDGPADKMPGDKMKEVWRNEVRKYEAAILRALNQSQPTPHPAGS